jgi:hypothetical protein
VHRIIILRVLYTDVKLGLSCYGKNITFRVFEKRLLGKILKPKGEEVRRSWRKIRNI